jgi:4-hydroxy-tetrahydrodipicolinate synthase
MSIINTLKGTGVAIVTPFKANAEVDIEALDAVIDFTIANGVNYIVSIGTTGESPVISPEEKKEIVTHTYQKVNNRVPVVVGIGGNNTAELVKELASFPLEKATAVLSASPYYSKPSQAGLFQHYKTLAQASPKPLLLYNVPGRTGRNISAATILQLAHEVPNIVGIKEAGADIMQCMQVLKNKPDHFLVVSGDDALALPHIACGMQGVISVVANCLPKQFSTMINHCLAGHFETAKTLNDTMLEVYEWLFEENNPAGVKAFLAAKGLIKNSLRLPVTPVSEALYEKIKNWVSVNKII